MKAGGERGGGEKVIGWMLGWWVVRVGVRVIIT